MNSKNKYKTIIYSLLLVIVIYFAFVESEMKNNRIEELQQENEIMLETIDNLKLMLEELQQEIDSKNAEIEKYKLLIKQQEESIKQLNEKVAYKRDIPLSDELQKFVYEKSKEYGVPYDTALAVMKLESNFDSKVVNVNNNGTKDYGLFQINTVNHQWLQKELGSLDFFNPYDNITAGTYMLGQLYEKYDNENMVLLAYNRGEGGMKALVNRGIYSNKYTQIVHKYRKDIKENSL